MAYIFFLVVNFMIFTFKNISDPDYFFHFFTGKYILDNGIVPKYDIFSWDTTKVRWYVPSWGFDVLSYILENKMLLLVSILMGVMMFILLKMYFKDFKKINILKSLLFVSFMLVINMVWVARPTIFSFLFFAIAIYILFGFINNEDKKFNKLIYLLPLIQFLWVNFHAASSSLMYVLILMILVINLFKSFKWDKIEHIQLNKKKIKVLLIVLFLVLVATLVNPNGYEIFYFVFSNFNNDVIFSKIIELQSPNFSSFVDLIFFGGSLFIFLSISFFSKDKKYLAVELLISLAFICLYLKAVRFYPYLIVLLVYMVGKYMDFPNKNFVTLTSWKKETNIYLALVFITAVNASFLIDRVDYKEYINFDRYYSEELVQTLINEEPKRLSNDFDSGSYLTYMFLKNNSELKVFTNGLAEIYSHSIMLDNLRLYSVKCNVSEMLKKYDFDYIVLHKGHSLYNYPLDKEGYEIIYEDKTGVIYKKNVIDGG